MKKYINGKYIELTAGEISELESEEANEPVIQPTTEERIDALETENSQLKAAINLLISGNA
ncbi:MAG: hypothetical protein VB118_04225 [Oscillospiraceae bacterium]|nr:hypothetical protein [Oscillospiraceae bacterium]